jgi:hypothetical protein
MGADTPQPPSADVAKALASLPEAERRALSFQDKAHKRETEASLERVRLAYQDRKEQREHQRTVGFLAVAAVLLAFGIALHADNNELAEKIIMAALPAGALALGVGRQKPIPKPKDDED